MLLVPVVALPSIAAEPAPVAREFRGVWVATVSNIDWPSRKGLSAAQQKAELKAIFDKAVQLNLNAVVLQVRPMCDALYESKLEPWSEYLTGTLGKNPGYDPLAFAVREAHARGLELHAWFNPYRAHHPSATSPIPDDHLVKKRPDLAKRYGKHYWLNPTNAEVAEHTLAVVLDIVRRYDIDGVHMDDYFYPYAEKDDAGKLIPFPDDDTWEKYQKSGGKLSRSDWRRDAVNRFVEKLYREVKSAKSWVKVGISPFGIWRPGHPPGIAGLDQYEALFADAKKWWNEGWVDYFTPQLYWPIKQEKQSYPKLLAWWASENAKKRHLWPGNIPSRVTGQAKGWPASEIAEQVKATRAQAGAGGNIHFSMKPLMQNTGGVAAALAGVYAEPALVPASPWLDDRAPPKPTLALNAGEDQWQLKIAAPGKPIRNFVVRSLTNGKWTTSIPPANGDNAARLTFKPPPDEVRVSAIDRVGNESPVASVKR
jgi:uncharacterized lipoprotein YddW (UPF0748 family)